MASGRDNNAIPVNEFYAPDSIDLTHGNYLCVDGLYYAYKGDIPGSLFMAAQTYVWDHQTVKGEGDGDIDGGG